LFRKFGLDAKDIVILQGGTQPSRLQGLSAGILDATLISSPLDLVAKRQGLNILTTVAELDIREKIPPKITFVGGGYIFIR